MTWATEHQAVKQSMSMASLFPPRFRTDRPRSARRFCGNLRTTKGDRWATEGSSWAVGSTWCFVVFWGQDECSNLHFQGALALSLANVGACFGWRYGFSWLIQLGMKTGQAREKERKGESLCLCVCVFMPENCMASSLPTAQRKWHRCLLRLVQMQCLWSFCKAVLLQSKRQLQMSLPSFEKTSVSECAAQVSKCHP